MGPRIYPSNQSSRANAVGSLILNLPNLYLDDIEVTVNGQLRNIEYSNLSGFYTTHIGFFDSVSILLKSNPSDYFKSIQIYRRNYTTDDLEGNNGISDTFILQESSSSDTGLTVNFTAVTTNDSYNFEYRVNTSISSTTPTPTPTPTSTPTPTPSGTPTPTPTPSGTPTPTPTITPTSTPLPLPFKFSFYYGVKDLATYLTAKYYITNIKLDWSYINISGATITGTTAIGSWTVTASTSWTRKCFGVFDLPTELSQQSSFNITISRTICTDFSHSITLNSFIIFDGECIGCNPPPQTYSDYYNNGGGCVPVCSTTAVKTGTTHYPIVPANIYCSSLGYYQLDLLLEETFNHNNRC